MVEREQSIQPVAIPPPWMGWRAPQSLWGGAGRAQLGPKLAKNSWIPAQPSPREVALVSVSGACLSVTAVNAELPQSRPGGIVTTARLLQRCVRCDGGATVVAVGCCGRGAL